jgi:hypothetical protein
MEESVTYQLIITKGELKAGRKILYGLGTERFGQPSEVARSLVDSVEDPDRLAQLAQQVSHASSWEELLGLTSAVPPKRRGRRKS